LRIEAHMDKIRNMEYSSSILNSLDKSASFRKYHNPAATGSDGDDGEDTEIDTFESNKIGMTGKKKLAVRNSRIRILDNVMNRNHQIISPPDTSLREELAFQRKQMIGRRQEERSRDVAENRLLGSNIEKEDVFAVITLNNSEIESRPTTYTKEDRHKELQNIFQKENLQFHSQETYIVKC